MRTAFLILFSVTMVTGFFWVGTSHNVKAHRTTINEAKSAEVAFSKVGHPTFASPHAAPIAVHGDNVFVVNTPSDTVDVIDRKTREFATRIPVGVDPVSLAVRPDGKEVWVSNHVSDSVNVIDTDTESVTYLKVVATIQDFHGQTKATHFDEPVGIAFASDEKAYVALSSENAIAVVDVPTRKVVKRIRISAQDPRAIVVRGNRLYVIPFESNNKTQLSGGAADEIDGDLVTFDAWQHSIQVNNVLSLGHVTDIVKHPDVPDQDLFIYDTATDELVAVVDTLGTLLYGLTVDSQGTVFIAQTDARNHINGRAGTKQHDLTHLENRAFLNQVTRVKIDSNLENSATTVALFDLEPLPPHHPSPNKALATPFAIKVSDDDATLVVTAAGSDKVFTVNANTGQVLGRINVGAVPRGLAIEQTDSGQPSQAWVYNAVANSVSLVDLTDLSHPQVTGFVPLEDPTDRAVKLGRTWFNDADASTTGTFSCASCHPDGHTDQLLWVLKTPIVTGGNQIMPRSTMPIRGLQDTAPFHWDGIPGDPYGGNNSANVHGSDQPNSNLNDPTSTARHLIDGGLASTMLMTGDSTINDEGKSGLLTAAKRDDMATFLLSLPYPPAPQRGYDNVVSADAMEGFRLFHIDGDLDPSKPAPNVCGDCHRMPYWVSTNTPGTGMDAPTWRGAYDRFLILPQGRLNIMEFDFYARVAERGNTEREIWQFSWGGRSRFNPVWNMVLEGSTGFSGAFARQVTLNHSSVEDAITQDLLEALEQSASESAIVLESNGILIKDESSGHPVSLQFQDGLYHSKSDANVYTRQELVNLAAAGKFIGTFTGQHGISASAEHPQPAIWTLSPIEQQSGRQKFPILHADNMRMTINGRHIQPRATTFVDGRRVSSKIEPIENEQLVISLDVLPTPGMHLLQIQNPSGLFSNDFIFHVTQDAATAAHLKRELDQADTHAWKALEMAISAGDLSEVTEQLSGAVSIRKLRLRDGMTPLSFAALLGHSQIVDYLIERGANASDTNQDGNTPLHVAAFLCRTDIVDRLLMEKTSPLIRNGRGETVIDIVSTPWNESLAGFYGIIDREFGLQIDLGRIQSERPKIATRLRKYVADFNNTRQNP